MSEQVIRIGTRGSRLAQAQTRWVGQRLEQRLGRPVEYVIVRTRGDDLQKHDVSPSQNLGVGLFTKALEDALAAEDIDLAVHSLKDLPCDIDPRFVIAAVPEREDSSDALCAQAGLNWSSLPRGARLGTGSPRRRALLSALRPDLEFVPIRGNVDTRLKRIEGEQACHAVVLATSGLKRAGLSQHITEGLPILPAPGQGALALQVRAQDSELQDQLKAIDDAASRLCAQTERQLHARLGGGCLTPLGALARCQGERLSLKAAVARLNGGDYIEAEAEGSRGDSQGLIEEVARRLEQQGVQSILEAVRKELE